ncbi:MAG: hypothetical protein JSV94_06955, partial [Methanobacteriota archaeon]
MSEDSKLGEPSSDGGATIEAAEPAQQPPSGGRSDKKKLWITIVAVVVAAALIGSVAYVMIGGDTGNDDGSGDTELTVTMSPDPIPSVAAGGVQILSMEVRADGEIVGKTDGVEYLWSVTPSNLGKLDFYVQPNTTFTAGDAGGEGVVACKVTYEGETVIVNSSLVVNPPFLDTVSVSPSTKVLAIDAEWDFTAIVIDSISDVVVDATITWTVSGIDADNYTLSSTTGAMVTFSASIEAEVNLTATATKGAETLSGSANITIVAEPIVYERTVDYLWYDMFEHELGPWYEDRWDNYGNEYVLTDSYPYLYLWCTDSWDF